MAVILSYEYACALKDAGYPQPEFAEGQTWYSIETAQVYDVLAHGKKSGKFLRRPKMSELAYAPRYEELEADTRSLDEKYSVQELAYIWMLQNEKR